MYNVSYRKLAFLILGPLSGDLLAAMFLFWMNVQAVRMGVPPRSQAWIGALFGVGYTLSSLLAARWSTRHNAARLLSIGIVAMTALGTLSLFTTQFGVSLVLATLLGVAVGDYFVPFQVMMGHVRPFATLAWTVAFYNISWGTGYACGPFLCGFLRGHSVWWLVTVAVGVSLAVLGLLRMVRHDPRSGDEDRHPASVVHSTPLLRRISWVSIAASCVLFAGLASTLWPALGGARGLSDKQIGLGLFVMGIQLPLSSMIWARVRNRLGQPWLLIGLDLLCGAGFLLLHLAPAWPWGLVGMAVFGFGHTGVIFHAVYYANADPANPSRSVGINETVIGTGTVLGPLVLGALAWDDATSLRPYAAGTLLMVGAAIVVPFLFVT